ncbi:MAG: RNA polymerase sigma factor [Sneathiella sp.]|nr:RNA polymerase sigma factor [Sneathiella sp.]
MRHSTPIESDAALMKQVADGNMVACRTLAARHLDHAYGLAFRVIGDKGYAEDIAQESFLRLWKIAPKWHPSAQIKTWLFRVIHNLCIDRLRKENRYSGTEIPEIIDPAPNPYQMREAKQLQDAVSNALQKLPLRQRTAITLVHFQQCGNIEAADIMDISVEALESLLSRGRRKLRELLDSSRSEFDGDVR